MGGVNPYNQDIEIPKATQPFEITFLPMNKTVSVDPEEMPFGHDGRSGSILDIALGAGIDIDHACGGVNACSTCHVIVRDGLASCNEATDDEEDMLDTAPGLELNSRLSCQAVPNGSTKIIAEVPGWNRNHANESH